MTAAVRPAAARGRRAPPTARRGKPVTRTRSTRSSRGREGDGLGEAADIVAAKAVTGPILRSPPASGKFSAFTRALHIAFWTSATATMAAVSTRRMRGPSPTGTKPAARAASTSTAVRPPSGPTSSAVGARARRLGERRAAATARAPPSHSASRRAGSSGEAERRRERAGADPPRHVGATALPGRLARDLLPAHAPPGLGTRDRARRQRRARCARRPAPSVFCTRKSMRSPRGTAVSSTIGAPRAPSRRRRAPLAERRARSRARPTRPTRASTSPPAPSNSVTASPGRDAQHPRQVAVVRAGHA